MGAAPLPGRAGEHCLDGADQPAVIVGDDVPDVVPEVAEASGHQIAQERRPGGTSTTLTSPRGFGASLRPLDQDVETPESARSMPGRYCVGLAAGGT